MRRLNPHLTISPLLLLAFAFETTAQDFATNLNPNGAGCVDPSTFLKCYQNNIDTATKCANDVKTLCSASTIDDCLAACGYSQLAANIGCWLTSCWNQAYSCAYQGTVLQYIVGADRVQSSVSIPYYPAPEDAPDRCVCNLGQVYGNWSNYLYDTGDPCLHFVTDGSADQANCACCYESSILTNIGVTCPHNDLSDLGISSIVNALQFAYNESVSNQCSVLSQNPGLCSSRYGIEVSTTGAWLNPGALPTGFPGVEPLSEVGGPLTTAPAPYTFNLFPGYSSIITPASYDAKNAAGSGAVASATAPATPAGSSGSGSGSGSAGSAGGAAAGTTTGGSAAGAPAATTGSGSGAAGAAATTTTSKSGAERLVATSTWRWTMLGMFLAVGRGVGGW